MLGAWAFLAGVILAVIFGFLPGYAWVAIALFVIGIVIGLLNVTDTEVNQFLLAAVALVIVANFAGESLGALPYVDQIFANLIALFVPAAVIVALKSVFSVARK